MLKIAFLVVVVVTGLYFGLGVLVKLFLRGRFLAVIAGTKGICLTFDDGPDEVITPQILDLLKEYETKATFFLVGGNVDKHPQLARQIIEMGHEIGEHGYRHINPWISGPLKSSLEVIKAKRVMDQLCSPEGPILYRPPYGKLNLVLLLYLWWARRRMVFWNVDPRDYQQQSGQEVSQFVIDRLASGSVILLHDGRAGDGSKGSVTVTALRLILEEIKRRKLALSTVGELLGKSA